MGFVSVPGQVEVNETSLAVYCNHDVRSADIAMKDSFLIHILHC